MKTTADAIDSMHFLKDYISLLLDGSEFTIGRKPQNGSPQVVSSATLLKSRNFNAPPNRSGEKTALQLVSTGFCVT
jgi:hypothetical protein